MQSKVIYKIDVNGEVEGTRLPEEDVCLERNETDKPIPDGLFKPRFDFETGWYEGATQEELLTVENILNGNEEVALTDVEKLAQAVSDLEIKDMEKNELIVQLGQQVTDLEIQLLESEGV